MQRRDLIELAIAVALVAAVAVFGAFVEKGALRDGIIRFCAIGLYAMSLNVLVGYTGMLSIGHAMFYGLGAYAFCLLVKSGAVGIPLALVLTLLITVAVAMIVGIVCVRTTRVYFSFITLAISMLFYSTILAWNSFTGGEQGLSGIPRQPFGIDLNSPFQYLMVSVILFVVSVLILRRILNSPFGASLRMIRDNPQRCVFIGINVLRVKLIAFVISAVFASLGGVLMSLYVSGAYPNFAYWTMSGEGLFMIMLGGVNVFLGPAFGAGLLLALESLVSEHAASHQGILLGAVILVTALGLRKGLLEFVVERVRQAQSPRVQSPVAAERRGEVAGSAPTAPLVSVAGERK